MTITMTYRVTSLKDLADEFERRANECQERIENGGRMRMTDKAHEGGMSLAFEQVAEILRNTTLEGPPHGGS